MASKYWVGGTGTWNASSTASWAITSGGAGGTAIPTSADDVFIDTASGSGTVTLAGSVTCKTLTVTSTTLTIAGTNNTPAIAGNLTLGASTTITFSGTLNITATATITTNAVSLPCNLTINATGGTVTLGGNTTITGTNNTLTLTAGTLALSTFTLNTTNFDASGTSTKTINFGTGTFNITYAGGGGAGVGPVNISATGTTIAGTSANRKFNFNGAYTGNINVAPGAFGLASAQDYTFNAAGSGANVQFNTTGSVRNLTFSSYTGTIAISNNTTISIYGNLSLSTNFTSDNAAALLTFKATSGTQTITSNGFTTPLITVDGVGGTVQLQDALTTSSVSGSPSITLTNGTFNANNFNVTIPQFASNNSNTRTLTMGSGTWTLTSTGTVWNLATTTGLTFNKDTSTILLSNSSTTQKTFAGGGLTYNNITIGGTTGIAIYTFTGNNTFATFAKTKTSACTITLPASGTTTVSNWTASGTVGNILTINSSTAATASTLTKTGGGVISGINYLTIQDSSATPSNTWYAGNNSTNTSNNTGWIFSAAPNGNYFLLF
jgi:hypothetical protein